MLACGSGVAPCLALGKQDIVLQGHIQIHLRSGSENSCSLKASCLLMWNEVYALNDGPSSYKLPMPWELTDTYKPRLKLGSASVVTVPGALGMTLKLYLDSLQLDLGHPFICHTQALSLL